MWRTHLGLLPVQLPQLIQTLCHVHLQLAKDSLNDNWSLGRLNKLKVYRSRGTKVKCWCLFYIIALQQFSPPAVSWGCSPTPPCRQSPPSPAAPLPSSKPQSCGWHLRKVQMFRIAKTIHLLPIHSRSSRDRCGSKSQIHRPCIWCKTCTHA